MILSLGIHDFLPPTLAFLLAEIKRRGTVTGDWATIKVANTPI